MGEGHKTGTPLHGEEGRSQRVCQLDTRRSLPAALAPLAAVSPDTDGRSKASGRRSREGASPLATREERQGWKPPPFSTHKGTRDRCLRTESCSSSPQGRFGPTHATHWAITARCRLSPVSPCPPSSLLGRPFQTSQELLQWLDGWTREPV